MKVLIPPELLEPRFVANIEAISSGIEIVSLGTAEANRGWRRMGKDVLRRVVSGVGSALHRRLGVSRRSRDVVPVQGNDRMDDVKVVLHSWMVSQALMRRVLDHLPNLEWVHTTLAGVERLPIPELISRGVILTNSSGVHSGPVSEFAVAMVLAMAKRLPDHFRMQLRREWGAVVGADELRGKTVGIVGFGRIGSETARRLAAFQVEIIATRRNPAAATESEVTVLSPSGLPTLLEASDFVILSVPLTGETRGMIGQRELDRLKESAYLINVSRAQVVEEGALARALREGRIAGACCDVFAQEPLPPTSPLYRLPNLLMTHHSAYASPSADAKAKALFLDNLQRFVAGKELRNMVNRERGY